MSIEDKSDRFVQQLHDTLWRDWDPLNVNRKADMEDEYDTYIESILDIFEDETANANSIKEFLLWVEDEHFKKKPNEARAIKVSEKIWAAFLEFMS